MILVKITIYYLGRSGGTCLHTDCKSKTSKAIVKRTWLANVSNFYSLSKFYLLNYL